MPYRAWFRCIAGCSGEHPLDEAAVPLPHLRRSPRGRARPGGAEGSRAVGVDAAVRRPLQAHHLALRLGGVGQEGVGAPEPARPVHRLDGRGRHQPAVGRALRPLDRRRRSVDQAVRQLAHRIVQGPRHDGARLGGAADARRRHQHPRRRLRLDRRHLGVARRLLRRRRHPGDRAPAARQGLDRAARAAARQRRHGAVARHRLRRLHAHRPAPRRRRARLPRQLDEQPAPRRPEDGGHRDRAAVRLEGARRRGHPGRQPRQRQRARRRLRHDARRSGSSPRRRASSSPRRRAPTRSTSPTRTTGSSSRSRRSRRWPRRSRSATRCR